MLTDCTGIILAGGLNSRFSGKNKAFLKIGGKSIIGRVYSVYKEVFDRIVIVASNPALYTHLDATITSDFFNVKSALVGIHSGLKLCETRYAFFTACDAPFPSKGLIEKIVSEAVPGVEIVIPETSAGLEPLFAVYSKNCLHHIEERINRGDYKIRSFFKSVKVKKLLEPAISEVDPEFLSFLNVNTPDDLESINKAMIE